MIALRPIASTVAAAFLATATAFAGAPARAAGAEWTDDVQVAQADCYSVGQQVAEQNGGTLAAAKEANRGGQTVCVVVVLVPGKDGQRPRRMEIVVPLN